MKDHAGYREPAKGLMLRNVKLFDVHGGLVHEQVIPPMPEAPDIIMFHFRPFALPCVDADLPWDTFGPTDVPYVEGLTYSLTIEFPGQ